MNSRAHYFLLICLILYTFNLLQAEVNEGKYGVFDFEHVVILPGTTQDIYDVITGDISPWWDHTFSKDPVRFYIEAKPGGGFYEIFDESGDGVRHAVVLIAHRGRMLRFEGPLGLSGRAIKGVYTYTIESAAADSSQLKLEAHLSGEIDLELAKLVENVWAHFLFERLSPYIQSGSYKKPASKD